MKSLSFMLFLLVPTLAGAASKEAPGIRLDLIQGSPTHDIAVHRSGGSHGQDSDLRVKEGEFLQAKDELKTGPGESVRVVFPDGSQLWVGGSTLVRVNSGIAEGGQSIQLIHLMEGSGRIIVPKTYGTSRKIKFVVKTPAATIGVRGTDFVVDAHQDGKDVELHTLEGTVDAAKSIKKLIRKDVVAVASGFTIHALEQKPIPQPTPFDVSEYTAALNKREPAFTTYAMSPIQQAPTESSPQGIKQKVEQISKDREKQLDRY
jgi:hypothetical protein